VALGVGGSALGQSPERRGVGLGSKRHIERKAQRRGGEGGGAGVLGGPTARGRAPPGRGVSRVCSSITWPFMAACEGVSSLSGARSSPSLDACELAVGVDRAEGLISRSRRGGTFPRGSGRHGGQAAHRLDVNVRHTRVGVSKPDGI
jgi:hypothetical protein